MKNFLIFWFITQLLILSVTRIIAKNNLLPCRTDKPQVSELVLFAILFPITAIMPEYPCTWK
jgi:hypothetical protein